MSNKNSTPSCASSRPMDEFSAFWNALGTYTHPPGAEGTHEQTTPNESIPQPPWPAVTTPQRQSNSTAFVHLGALEQQSVPMPKVVTSPQVQPEVLQTSIHEATAASQTVFTPQAESNPSTSTEHIERSPREQPVTMPQLASAPQSVPTTVSTPDTPSTTPSSSTASLFMAVLMALQSQLNTLQGDYSIIKSDIKDVLSALTTIRTKQAQIDERIDTLEDVIGIEPDCTMAMVEGRTMTRRAKRRTSQDSTAEPAADGQAPAETQEIPALIHTLSCIQASVYQLLRHEKEILPPPPRVILKEVATSPLPSPPTPSASLPTIDPTMNLSTSEQPSLLPPSPDAIHTHDLPTPPAQPAPERSFVEASIQACPLSPPPEPPCTLRRSLTLTPVDWNANPMTHFTRFPSSARPSAYTAEYKTRFARDADQVTNQTSSNANANTNANVVINRDQTRIRAPNSKSDSERVTVDDLRRLMADTVTVTKHVPMGTMSAPNVSQGKGLELETRTGGAMMVQNGLCDEGSSREKKMRVGGVDVHASGGMESQATPPRYRRTSMPMVEAEPTNMPNASDTPVPGFELQSNPSPMEEPEDDGMDMDMDMDTDFEHDRDCDSIPRSTTDSESTSPMTPRLDDSDGGCPSGLPTPPSDEPTPGLSTFASFAVVPNLGHDSNVGRDGHSSRSVAVIVTPPAVTPPPSSGSDTTKEARGAQGGDERGVDVGHERVDDEEGLGLPMTPPPPSPFVGRRAEEVGVDEYQDGGTKDEMADGIVDEQGTRENEINVGGEEQVDTPTRQSPRSDSVDPRIPTPSLSEETTCVIPVIAVTQHSQSATPPNIEKDQGPLSAGYPDIITPSSSTGLSDLDLFKFQSDFSAAYCHNLGLEFPARHSYHPASATSSRYQTPTPTPSEATSSHVTQDEEEVWDALVLGRSGVSTPASILYGMYSRGASVLPATATGQPEAQQEMLSIDPSMLQFKTHPPQPPPESSPRLSEASLSSLTSLAETGVEDHGLIHDAARTARRSEPLAHHGDARPSLVPPTRAVSEMTSRSRSGSRPLGGPGASLEELLMMARRRPLKIRIRVPESMRGVKRKRREMGGVGDDDDDGDGDVGQDEDRETEASGEDEAPLLPRLGVALTTPAPTPTPPACSVPGINVDPRPPKTHTLEDALPIVPRKKFKRATPRKGGKNEVRSRKKTVKQGPKRYPTYYVQNGEVVMAEPESASTPCSAATFPMVEPQEPNATNAMNTPPESPVRPPPACSSSDSPRTMTASPTKEDVWSKIGMGDGTWPTLPSAFSQWDEQFIQCDNCDLWYHYGCVGIEEGDPRLEDGALFICPTCLTQSAKRRAQRKNHDTCARPDCPEPVGNTDNYIVQRLIGRKRLVDGVYHWLAKWEGYPMSQASWIPEENVTSGRRALFGTFEADAAAEGVDLSKAVVLLEEAVEAGWENYT